MKKEIAIIFYMYGLLVFISVIILSFNTYIFNLSEDALETYWKILFGSVMFILLAMFFYVNNESDEDIINRLL